MQREIQHAIPPTHTTTPTFKKERKCFFFTSLEASRERLIQRSRSADCVYEDEKINNRLLTKKNIKELLTSIKTSGGFELTIHKQTSNWLPQIFRWLRDKCVFQRALEAKVYSAYKMFPNMLGSSWKHTNTKTCRTAGVLQSPGSWITINSSSLNLLFTYAERSRIVYCFNEKSNHNSRKACFSYTSVTVDCWNVR